MLEVNIKKSFVVRCAYCANEIGAFIRNGQLFAKRCEACLEKSARKAGDIVQLDPPINGCTSGVVVGDDSGTIIIDDEEAFE